MRINAVKDLLFTLSADMKKLGRESDSLKEYVAKNASDQNIEVLMSKESLDHELQNLIASNYAMEAELQEFRDKIKDVKKVPEKNINEADKAQNQEENSLAQQKMNKKLSVQTEDTVRPGRSKEASAAGLAKVTTLKKGKSVTPAEPMSS